MTRLSQEQYNKIMQRRGEKATIPIENKKTKIAAETGTFMKLIIQGELPSLNEIIDLSKRGNGSYQPYNEIKQKFNRLIAYECEKQLKGISFTKIFLNITWYCKNKKQDKDNIAVGLKFILDGMVHAEVIENDGWKQIEGFSHNFETDKENPRIEILINEIGTKNNKG